MLTAGAAPQVPLAVICSIGERKWPSTLATPADRESPSGHPGGDELAREQLIKASQERLRRLASKMLKGFPGVARVGGQTEDVLQPVLMRLHEVLHRKNFERGQALVAYAATMIRCELLDLARKYRQELAQRITNHPDGTGRPVAVDVQPATPDDLLARVEKWGRLHEAVEQLPEDEKRVIEHRFYQDISRQETAVLLGVNEKTVTRRYGRALEKLGQALGDLSFT